MAKKIKSHSPKHRLTPAQKSLLLWVKQVSGPHSRPCQHLSATNPRDTANVLIREGYLRLGKPSRWGQCCIYLTYKGRQHAQDTAK